MLASRVPPDDDEPDRTEVESTTVDAGWLARAVDDPRPEVLVSAALRGEVDPLESFLGRAICGRREREPEENAS